MSGAQEAAIQVAETIQTAHINRKPTVEHDLAPATAAEHKQPVRFDTSATADDLSDIDEDEIPVSILRPTPRRPQMPPLPDLRFEQSYLASIKDAKGWQGMAFITIRDQAFMPLVQGMAWTLIVAGWKHWNGATKFSGQSVGAKIRRWWWDVNGWKIPNRGVDNQELAEGVREFSVGHANAGSD